MELSEFVVTIEEDDESDEVHEDEADDCAAGDSLLMFAYLALRLCRGETPLSPGNLLSPGRAGQSLPHSSRDVLTKGRH